MKKPRTIIIVAVTLCIFIILLAAAFASETYSVLIQCTGTIESQSPGVWSIGQYSNGTFFAVNPSGQTYATDPNYASALINNAMQMVSQNGGGIVKVGNGAFLLNTPLIGHSNVYLQVSYEATIYQNPLSSLAASISLLITQSSVQNFVVSGGTWNGNRGSLSDHRGSSTWNSYFANYMGISISYGNNVTVENAVIENVINSGIYTYEVSNAEVANCTVLNAGDNPITFNGNTSGNPDGNWNDLATNCTVNGGQDVGINTFHCDNCTISDCNVSNVSQYSGASHWGIAAENSNDVNIIGNTISNCPYLIESTSTNVLIADNIVDSTLNWDNGIGINFENDNQVINNTIVNGIEGQFPLMAYGVTNSQFINNTITGSYCRCDISGTNILIQGGSISGNTGGLMLDGTNNAVVMGVTFTGWNGIIDNGQTDNNTYIVNCNFSQLGGTPLSMPDSFNTTLQGNSGLSGYQTLNVTLAGSGVGIIAESNGNQSLASINGSNWQFPPGSTATLTPIASPGSSFVNFTLATGTETTSNPLIIVMNENQGVTASFNTS